MATSSTLLWVSGIKCCATMPQNRPSTGSCAGIPLHLALILLHWGQGSLQATSNCSIWHAIASFSWNAINNEWVTSSGWRTCRSALLTCCKPPQRRSWSYMSLPVFCMSSAPLEMNSKVPAAGKILPNFENEFHDEIYIYRSVAYEFLPILIGVVSLLLKAWPLHCKPMILLSSNRGTTFCSSCTMRNWISSLSWGFRYAGLGQE